MSLGHVEVQCLNMIQRARPKNDKMTVFGSDHERGSSAEPHTPTTTHAVAAAKLLVIAVGILVLCCFILSVVPIWLFELLLR